MDLAWASRLDKFGPVIKAGVRDLITLERIPPRLTLPGLNSPDGYIYEADLYVSKKARTEGLYVGVHFQCSIIGCPVMLIQKFDSPGRPSPAPISYWYASVETGEIAVCGSCYRKYYFELGEG